jgi:hypothetical protein
VGAGGEKRMREGRGAVGRCGEREGWVGDGAVRIDLLENTSRSLVVLVGFLFAPRPRQWPTASPLALTPCYSSRSAVPFPSLVSPFVPQPATMASHLAFFSPFSSCSLPQAATMANGVSSRSHAVLQLSLCRPLAFSCFPFRPSAGHHGVSSRFSFHPFLNVPSPRPRQWRTASPLALTPCCSSRSAVPLPSLVSPFVPQPATMASHLAFLFTLFLMFPPPGRDNGQRRLLSLPRRAATLALPPLRRQTRRKAGGQGGGASGGGGR